MTAQPNVAIHPGHRFTTVTIGGATVAVSWKAGPEGPWYVTDGTGPATEHPIRSEADGQVAEYVAHALEFVPLAPGSENCNLCRHLGHAESDHPLPRNHPQYDAFYDASDDELRGILATAIRPGKEN